MAESQHSVDVGDNATMTSGQILKDGSLVAGDDVGICRLACVQRFTVWRCQSHGIRACWAYAWWEGAHRVG
jgi:hypothetical protein